MGETDKPFACTNKGCLMTFTNEDHLNVHRKKHDMVLNLGLSCKSNVTADQTPTPTRFIRNCEEVGLFQDLQNVNPFEETFKKAIEYSKTGSIHVPDSSNDDSLHTPQIFHHLSNNNSNKLPPTPDKHDSAIDNNLLTDSKDSSSKDDDDDEDIIEIIENDFSCSMDFSSSNENEYDFNSSNSNEAKAEDLSIIKKNLNNFLFKSNKNSTKSDVKEKIKEALHNKRKSDIKPLNLKVKDNDLINSVVKKPRQRISLKSELKNSVTVELYSEGDRADNPDTEKNLNEVEKRRAMNRMAQMRSRKRKKMWLDEMEKEIEKLKMENKSIIMENQKLKEENIHLKSMLLKHDSCSLADSNNLTGTIHRKPTNSKNLVAIQPVLYTIRSSSNNLIAKSTSSNVKSLPKLLPKSTVSPNLSSKKNCSEYILPDDIIHLNNGKVINLTNIKVPQPIVLQMKTTKNNIQ